VGDTVAERYLEEVNYALTRAIGEPRTVLDVGCGRGQNSAVARGRGARVVGVELNAVAAATARERLDEVLEMDVEGTEVVRALAGRKFDLILLGDVLEHTREPRAVLERFLPFLEDGGRVIVSLPNVAAWTVRLQLLAGHFDYQPSGILDETHLRFFTRQTAKRLVESVGLELLSVELNPMIVRAGLGAIKRALLPNEADGDPAALADNPMYQRYLRWVRPVEGQLASLAPGPLAFQTVVVARKAPERRKLSLTVGMISMNEAGAVAAVIDQIRAHAPEAEILIVDSSTDSTPEIAREKGARVVRQFPPRGYGPAMHELLYQANTDVIVTMDCDATYPPERIAELHQLIEQGADLVNAARTRHRPANMPFPNYVGNRVFASIARVLHGIPTADLHSGMRAYRTSMLRGIRVDADGPALPVELLLLPARLGYRIVEVDIPYYVRVGQSTLDPLASSIWTLRRIAKTLADGRRISGRIRRGQRMHPTAGFVSSDDV
jgi:SAM-dependent methyltransferase